MKPACSGPQMGWGTEVWAVLEKISAVAKIPGEGEEGVNGQGQLPVGSEAYMATCGCCLCGGSQFLSHTSARQF